MIQLLLALFTSFFVSMPGSVQAPGPVAPAPAVQVARHAATVLRTTKVQRLRHIVRPAKKAPVTEVSASKVGDYPYIFVSSYCDPYIYCSVSNGTLIASLGPLVRTGSESWVTKQAWDAEQSLKSGGPYPDLGAGASPVQPVGPGTSFCDLFGCPK